ncbi:MAG TPA: hypothetical protein VN231_12395 [Allosphingosinicella sp.]|nr:hypothetical protein [Allosphingosinicella sp.]
MDGKASIRFDDPLTRRIVAFLERIGIGIELEPLGDDTFLPAIQVRGGGLVVDPDRLQWPGDLLHEAGHVALADPGARASLDKVSDDPGEEMAAIAWSYAAALEIGLDPAIVFHDQGYHGGGRALAEGLARGALIGTPLLECYDMAADSSARAQGAAPYPHMLRWLR